MASPINVEVRASAGKGQGLFAKRDIKRGENILRETPIDAFDDATLRHFAGYDERLDPEIRMIRVFQHSALPIGRANQGHTLSARKSAPGAYRPNTNNLTAGGGGQRLAAHKRVPSTAPNYGLPTGCGMASKSAPSAATYRLDADDLPPGGLWASKSAPSTATYRGITNGLPTGGGNGGHRLAARNVARSTPRNYGLPTGGGNGGHRLMASKSAPSTAIYRWNTGDLPTGDGMALVYKRAPSTAIFRGDINDLPTGGGRASKSAPSTAINRLDANSRPVMGANKRTPSIPIDRNTDGQTTGGGSDGRTAPKRSHSIASDDWNTIDLTTSDDDGGHPTKASKVSQATGRAPDVLPLSDGNGGLFTMASKINHACCPNATFHWNTKGELNVQALVDIKEGDEITISYVGTKDWDGRQQELKADFDFECACAACSVDDKRRDDAINLANDLKDILESSFLDEPESTERTLSSLVELICSHLELRAELPSTLYDAFQFACANQDRAAAEHYEELALQYAALFQGQDNDVMSKFDALDGDPANHMIWGMADFTPSTVTRLDVEAMIGS